MKIIQLLATTLAAGLLAATLAGCATHRIDWDGRVGNYTLDQAILDFGPPDKQAKLEDGTVVADWLTRHGYSYSYGGGGYYYGHRGYYGPRGYWGYAPYPGPYLDSYSPDYFMRLTFGPDGKLKTWKKFAK